jgi:hypothetical protein
MCATLYATWVTDYTASTSQCKHSPPYFTNKDITVSKPGQTRNLVLILHKLPRNSNSAFTSTYRKHIYIFASRAMWQVNINSIHYVYEWDIDTSVARWTDKPKFKNYQIPCHSWTDSRRQAIATSHIHQHTLASVLHVTIWLNKLAKCFA